MVSKEEQERVGLELANAVQDVAMDYGTKYGLTCQQVFASILTVATAFLTPDGGIQHVLDKAEDPDVMIAVAGMMKNDAVGVAAHLLVLNKAFVLLAEEARRHSKRDAAQYN